ncbi:MAG: hypothetical protein Q8942_17045 [Bacillota bacterium]|nr:hypothetical protein [Bacillota bacterium]
MMSDRKEKAFENKVEGPTVAPGYDDEKFGEHATKEDIKKGNSTKVIRVFWDENDPSRK